MDSQKKQNEQEYIVTFADFKKVYRKSRRKIFQFALIFGLLAGSYATTRPVKYPIQASFKEKGQVKSDSQAPSISLLMGGSGSVNQSEATTWMKSENLMMKLIKQLDLQGSIWFKSSFDTLLVTIANNIKTEYALLANRVSPNLKTLSAPLKVNGISYDGEIPLTLEIKFITPTTYEVIGPSQQIIGQGTVNTPFITSDYSFTLAPLTEKQLPIQSYHLSLQPLNGLAKKLVKQIEFKPDLKDKELLNLSFAYPDRKMGAQIINTLMSIYKKHQEEEQKRITQNQIVYLEQRQKETKAKLKESMDTYAQEQASDVETNGFPNAEVALDFLGANQKEQHRKLMVIDLEIQRLYQVMEEGSVYYDRYHTDGDPAIINTLLSEIRTLKQQSDSIHLTLQETPQQANEGQNVLFIQQMSKLEETRRVIAELQELLGAIQADILLTPSEELLDDSRFMIKSWHEKLQEYLLEKNMHKLTEKEWEKHKGQYTAYLNNLVQLFHVHEKAMRERIAHQGDIEKEFRGINLGMANELFLENNRQLNAIESNILQYQFVLDKLQNPDFDLNSLQSLLTDPISNNIIATYSTLLFKLRDEGHRSAREQERIKNELMLQRSFLEMHIAQTTQVQNLTAHMLRKKLYSLQKVSLALIQQQISLLEKQLKDYLSNRINNLLQEKSLIETSLGKLKREMAKIPLRWNAEQLIKQQLEMNRHFGTELANLVESKNITANMDVSKSTAVDLAAVPLFPKAPLILLWTIIGAFLGGLGTFTTFLFKQAQKGAGTCSENLRAVGLNVSGSLTSEYNTSTRRVLLDRDLSTLRRAIHYLYDSTDRAEDKTMLLIGAKKVDFSKELALLFDKKGLKTLILHLSFDEHNDTKGLLSYLEGSIDAPAIHAIGSYDCIRCGGFSRYGHELICTTRFKMLLDDLNNKYDRIIAVSKDSPSSPEAESLAEMFEKICVITNDESLQEIHPLILAANNKRITFIIQE